jgi:hypothetical protein
VKGHYLLSLLRQIENKVSLISNQLKENKLLFSTLDGITSSILPKDDSAIICTEVKKAIDIDVEKAFADLYARIIERYYEEPEEKPHNDNYAWKKFYKQHFEKSGITQNFQKHSVKTHTDVIAFDKAWKNGVWNCYQVLSLDLSRVESIKNKIYRWSGILKELESTSENIHLYFLTVSPQKDYGLKSFIEENLTSKNQKVEVTLIKETDAEQFAEKIRQEMETHLGL